MRTKFYLLTYIQFPHKRRREITRESKITGLMIAFQRYKNQKALSRHITGKLPDKFILEGGRKILIP